MGFEAKQLKNSKSVDMTLRIFRAALGEASSLAVLGLIALAAEELKRRCVAEIKRKFRSHGARQAD